MDQKFFEEQFAAVMLRFDGLERRMDRIETRMDGIEKRISSIEERMDSSEKRMDTQDKRMESMEKIIHKMGIDIEAIRADVRLIAEGHVMLNQKFSRFESEYIHHAVEMRHDVLNLYKITYGDIERRVKELELAKK
jgi:chromosome segregation ATPase